jgi:hypothetical protein
LKFHLGKRYLGEGLKIVKDNKKYVQWYYNQCVCQTFALKWGVLLILRLSEVKMKCFFLYTCTLWNFSIRPILNTFYNHAHVHHRITYI